MIIGLYHKADHDGKCSAAIIRHKYPDAKLIGVDYDGAFPWKEINQEDTVIMSDFCLEPVDRMVHLSKKCKLIWIDHHRSSIKAVAEAGIDPDGLRMVGKSGCELTWQYLFGDDTLPQIVYHLGRYDVWDHTDSKTLPYQYGMLNENNDPMNDELWSRLLADDQELLNEIHARGEIIWDYQQKIDKIFIDENSFEATLFDYKAIVANYGRCSSLAFKSVWDPEKYDLMITFHFNGGRYKISLYTTKSDFNVGELATRLGGGGHRQAAGFSVKSPPPFKQLIVTQKE